MPRALRQLLSLCFALIFVSLNSLADPIILTNPFTNYSLNGLDPYWNWKTLESEHFVITFTSELAPVAQLSARYFEEAHSQLSPLLRWQPATKTQILVIDNSDTANGLTTPLLNFGIILWATPPDANSSTNFYDNWLRLLVFHEYTHLLNMDTTSGIWQWTRPLFGSVLLPNAAWAPWMLEGLAVYMETQFTQSGRGRSSYYEMILRSAVEEKVLNTPQFMTLDKINGTNPYFPGGDTRYIFGYSLMNYVARSSKGGSDTLGILSERSGGRIPFFINGNLENITGRDWYSSWDGWVNETQTRANQALEIIRSQPTTQYSLLTERDHLTSTDAEGIAISRDSQWLAYGATSTNVRPKLFLKNLTTGKTQIIADKLGGMGMAFTPPPAPNSPGALIYSDLNQESIYYLYSDLKVFDLQTRSIQFLTHHLRARDPDVSRDGQWVTFTLAENASTVLARASLNYVNGQYSLGKIEKLYIPPVLDRVANPKFSADGSQIYFTLHPNGKFQEDLMVIRNASASDLESNSPIPIVSDGFFNRFPTLNRQGDLYFVSNRTGVDNLYHYDPQGNSPTLVTNITTGLLLPAFDLNKDRSEVYASVFSTSGWDIARVQLSPQGLSPDPLKIPPPPVEENKNLTHPYPETQDLYSVQDYSAWSTLQPRMWTPLLGYSSVTGLGVGFETLGFDTTDRHRYIGAWSYSTQLNTFDFYALYSNRSFGPTFNLSAYLLTNPRDTLNFSENLMYYQRAADVSLSASFPIPLTYYSWLTPTLSLNLEKNFYYQFDTRDPSSTLKESKTPLYFSIDGQINFFNTESSTLALTSEGGHNLTLAGRYYPLPNGTVWKGIFIEQSYFKLLDHTVLSPSLKGTVISDFNLYYLNSSAILSGRTSQFFNAFGGDGLNSFSIRGYPERAFAGRATLVAALDLAFPLLRIFRGLGTLPVFFDNLYGFTFLETSILNTYYDTQIYLPSYGGGIRLTPELFTIPVTLSWEYHNGLNTRKMGTQDFVYQVSASTPF